ncbi:hypothetical protein ACJJTC_005004, partial [Scirpophaga incertulas]
IQETIKTTLQECNNPNITTQPTYANITNQKTKTNAFPPLTQSKTHKQSNPAIIVTINGATTKEECKKTWREQISFRKEKYLPTKITNLKDNKLKVEFDTIEQRDKTINIISKSKKLVAEKVKKLQPMFQLKGIPKTVESKELTSALIEQNKCLENLNPENPEPNLKLCFLKNNKNPHLYNAVFRATPEIWDKVLETERLNVDHSRVHVSEHVAILHCYKCLQNKSTYDELAASNGKEDLDVIFLTEPYTGRLLYAKALDGYTMFYNLNKSNSKKNKTAIAIKSNKFSAILVSSATTDNMTIVQTRDLSGKIIYLYSVYVEPKTDLDNTLIKLKTFLSLNTSAVHIITGDFNAWNPLWGSANSNPRGNDIVKMIINNDLVIVNKGNENTYCTTTKNAVRSSVIDLTMITDNNNFITIEDWKVNNEIITTSDHKAITFNINIGRSNLTKNLKTSTWKYNTNSSNFWNEHRKNEFISTLSTYTNENEIDNILYMNESQLEDYISKLTNNINKTCQRVLPRSAGLPRRPHWWSEQLDILKKKVISNHHRLSKAVKQKLPLDDLIKTKNELKSEYAKAIHDASTKSFKDFCNKQDKENVWSVTNRIIRTKPVTQTPSTLKKPDGTYTNNTEETAQYFIDNLYPMDTPDDDMQRSIRAEMSAPPGTDNEPAFTTIEIKEALKSFNSKKAPGCDGLTSDICLVAMEAYPQIFTNIINRALQLEYFPRCWKKAVAKIIPKPGKDTYDDIKSYRPIGLIPVLGKLYEKLIINRLTHYMYTTETNNEKQYGFKLQQSTISALHQAITVVRCAKKRGLQDSGPMLRGGKQLFKVCQPPRGKRSRGSGETRVAPNDSPRKNKKFDVSHIKIERKGRE